MGENAEEEEQYLLVCVVMQKNLIFYLDYLFSS